MQKGELKVKCEMATRFFRLEDSLSSHQQGCSDKRIPLAFYAKISETDDPYLIKSDFYYKNVYESNIPVIFGQETADWPVNQMSVEQIVDVSKQIFSVFLGLNCSSNTLSLSQDVC